VTQPRCYAGNTQRTMVIDANLQFPPSIITKVTLLLKLLILKLKSVSASLSKKEVAEHFQM